MHPYTILDIVPNDKNPFFWGGGRKRNVVTFFEVCSQFVGVWGKF
jgi:hypothetical protein